MPTTPMDQLATHAAEAAAMLKELANPNRLMIFCCLGRDEMTVSALNEQVALSQSALSQHLSRLRGRGLLKTRRDGHQIYYSLADARVINIIMTLKDIYCPE